MRQISPQEASRLPHRVIDVREFVEQAAGAIPGASFVPLAVIERECRAWDREKALILVCRSGKRAADAAARLERLGFQDVAVLDGGMDAWQRAGLPVHALTTWSMERQVRVAAGSMVFVSALLGLTVSHWFFGWTLFVGGGLTVSGLTNTCLMASLLGKLPWNRERKCRTHSSSF